MNDPLNPPMSAPEPANQPLRFKRDPETGLVIGKTYKYTPEGLIDYKAMVDKKHLYVAYEYRDQLVKERGKPLSEIDILTVNERWLRITIGGINQLAHLRGVRSCTYPHMLSREGYAATTCEMEFIPNIESDMVPEIWSGQASATIKSVDRNFIPYLETLAENRAFARCVKRALQINILADIEIGGEGKNSANETSSGSSGSTSTGVSSDDEQSSDNSSSGGFKPYNVLAELCRTPPPPMKPISFDALKEAAGQYITELKGNPAEWTGFESIQDIDAYLIIGKIKERAGAKMPKSTIKRS